MALRGWRLFGLAGTIFAYVAGILLLSILSLNNPNQRRGRGGGRFGEFDAFRHREINLIGKRQPLQWCQPLRYLDGDIKDITTKPPKLLQTFPGHYVRIPKKYTNNRNNDLAHRHQVGRSGAIVEPLFDDAVKEMGKATKPDAATDKVKSSYEKIWPNNKYLRNQNNQKLLQNGKLKEFRGHNLIALASFPGSGNTWLRYLLQQATGIYTGSVYKDFGLLKSGFPAENIFNSSVLIVKTHEWGPNAWEHFGKAILLVRDPDKAIIAEFNRQSGGHVGFASPDRYKRTKGRYWQQFVTNKLWAWEQMNLQWARNFTGEVEIIYYDDLVEDVEVVLRQALKFIKFPINEELLNCALSRKEGIYRRKKRIMTFDPYTPDMHKAIEEKKREVYAELGRYKF
ncbi:WSCD family member AGAP003962 [Bradysia coprophila]|uniref:WSCD family member AGAP003962 n=1 Tax=Bradysia coprophila TaxID=38358 RepID=UPI00187D84AB|nr:WSCD family member AGAP003962 [Bradysia coprophila]